MINPFILLGIGAGFAVLYATAYFIGWAYTRRCRRCLHLDSGIDFVPTLIFDQSIKNPPSSLATVSLTNNTFLDQNGHIIDVSQYRAYIAIGTSADYPGINHGDLILFDNTGAIAYAFTLPDITNFK